MKYEEYSVKVFEDGTIKWYDKNSYCHRIGGPAVQYASGRKEWRKHGRLHRDDGPAIEFSSGEKSWYKDGKLHRLDGPAREYEGGFEYYIEGIKYTHEEFFAKTSPASTVSCAGKILEFEGKKYKLVEV